MRNPLIKCVVAVLCALAGIHAAAPTPSASTAPERSIGDSAIVRGVAGHPLQVTLYGVYWARTADKDVCPCVEPIAGAVALSVVAASQPDALATFYGTQGGRMFSEDSATEVPWVGCDPQRRDDGLFVPRIARLVIVDLEVPAPGGELTYVDAHGRKTSWRLTGATAGTGFADARKYDVAYC